MSALPLPAEQDWGGSIDAVRSYFRQLDEIAVNRLADDRWSGEYKTELRKLRHSLIELDALLWEVE